MHQTPFLASSAVWTMCSGMCQKHRTCETRKDPLSKSSLHPLNCILKCKHGYHHVGKKSAKCVAGGRWSPAAIGKCHITCPKTLGKIHHGHIRYPTVTFKGTVATMTCNSGFHTAIGAATSATCTRAGTWSVKKFGKCHRLCHPTIKVANGVVHYPRLPLPGKVARVSCNGGHKLAPGSHYQAKCTKRGTWNKEKLGPCRAFCKENLRRPQHGEVRYGARPVYVGTKAHLRCHGDHEPANRTITEVRCKATHGGAKWSGQLGHCVPKCDKEKKKHARPARSHK